MPSTRLLFLSAGGTSIDVLGLLADFRDSGSTYEPIGYLDDDGAKKGAIVMGLPVLGPISDWPRFPDVKLVNCLGSPANYRRRRTRVEDLGITPDRFETIVHPTAVVSMHSAIGAGTIVYPHAYIGGGATIGVQALIMSHVSINHGVHVGGHAIVATGAILLGSVSVGVSTYIGAAASIQQGRSIGDGSLVGMGSVVVRDVDPNVVVAGTPARLLRKA
jgi:sugar O-acyltransferase (sialic acid O-acetyltransferase NeuD family)